MGNDGSPQQRTALVTVEGVGSYKVQAGLNLRETLRREGLYIDGTCSDNGSCGRCVVRVLEGNAGEPSLQEKELLGARFASGKARLACRITVAGDLALSIDAERILEIDRTGRWKEVWGSPLWHPERIEPDRQGYGLAVDLGTTSIAVCLFNLSSGKMLDIRAGVNPQMPWGEEIISRLDAASSDRAVSVKLSSCVWDTVREQARSLCLRSGVSKGRITRMVVVGNSAMHHLSLGLPVGSLLTPPYSPSNKSSMLIRAGDPPVSLEAGGGALVYFPSLVGGYAGSDALASLLSVRSEGVGRGALLDVGTNTEISVWNENSVLVATAPSGPAFEGGHIRYGMRAEEGAVWKVDIDDQKVGFQVVGGGRVKGICGTGMIDMIASMLRRGILDRSGLIVAGSHPRVTGDTFVLDEETGTSLGAEDVATVQKAKSAIAATLHLLLKTMGFTAGELDRIYIAGAFGSRLDILSAMTTGLLPSIPADRYVLSGNTALQGAAMMLLSEKWQLEGERLGRTVRHYSAAQDQDFEEAFIDNLYFPEV